MLRGRDIVCVGPTEWSGVWARPQQLMARLAARGNRILYVDPPVTALAPLKLPALRQRWLSPGSRLRSALQNIWVLEPPLFLPFGNKRRAINRLNQRLLASAIRAAETSLGFRDVTLWTYLPGTADLLRHVPYRDLCYDCVDDHSAFTGLLDPAVVRAMEDDLLRQADVTLATADALHRRCLALNPDAILVPNAVDFEHLSAAREPGPVPQEFADLARPVIGFVGALGDWIDVPLLARVAAENPTASLVLIGPALTDVSPLTGLPNVHLLGPRPYPDLPGYLRAFDVCLNPFRINQLTASVNPIKLYEYLAAGKEVVSTALPEVRAFADTVFVAEDEDGFAAAVQGVLSGRLAHPLEARLAVARANSWEERLKRIDEAFAHALRGA
ncbi:MAG: glycosyltransferase [Bacillota bacterium]